MQCPSCGHPDAKAADDCGRCGFNLGALDGLLGSRQVTVDPLIDLASCLNIADAQKVRTLLDAFERRFPQIAITVFIGDLPSGVNPAMAGMWLINHASLERQGQAREGSFAVAVIINPVTSQAGVATGYAVEEALSSAGLHAWLSRAAPLLWHQEHAKAIRLIVDGIDQTLRAHGQARRRQISAVPAEPHLGLPALEPTQSDFSAPPQ